MVIDILQEISDVIDNDKKLLDLLFGKVTFDKVELLLCNMESRLIMSVLDFHAKKVNKSGRNHTFLDKDHDSMCLNNLKNLLE